ncbi:MAG: hypothetical protein PVF73_09025 [Bacteroidales bacterium]|jgi:uncharacterized protein (TIGR00725 family)
MKKAIVGIIGPGETATSENKDNAYRIGRIVAGLGYMVLTGGRNCGVMDAALKGAKENNGITIGILPDDHKKRMSDFVDIPIVTGLGNARNNINVLSSDLIIAIGSGPGTLSEMALAIKTGKKILIDKHETETIDFLKRYDKSFVLPFDPVNTDELEKLIVHYI